MSGSTGLSRSTMATFLYDHDDLQRGHPATPPYMQSPSRNRRSFLRSESGDSLSLSLDDKLEESLTYRSASSLRTLSSLGGFTGLLPTPPNHSFESLHRRHKSQDENTIAPMHLPGPFRGAQMTPVVAFQGPPTPEYTPPKSLPKRKRSVHDLAGLCLRVSEMAPSQSLPDSEIQSRRSSAGANQALRAGANRESAFTDFEEDFLEEPFSSTLEFPISSDDEELTYLGPMRSPIYSPDQRSILSSSSDSSSIKRRKRSWADADHSDRRPVTASGTGSVRRRPRTGSLKDRIAQRSESKDRSPELEEFARQIHWPVTPSVDDQPLAYATNTNRLSTFSTLSANSRTVEAVIINTPPEKHHSLRRTPKLGALSLLPRSSPFQSRLFRRSSRGSSNSGKSAERVATRTSGSLREDVGIITTQMPVVVVGERQSSMRAATQGEKPRPHDLSAASLQTRMMLNDSGTFEQGSPAQSRRRQLSDAMAAASTRTGRSTERAAYPVIPKRGSSLSAPTSRNTSRTSTMTSGRPLHSARAPEDRRPSFGRKLSGSRTASIDVQTPRTKSRDQARASIPHSRRSLESGFSPYSMSPEVREARAISIFAHHSDAVRMVGARDEPPGHPQHSSSQYSDDEDDEDDIFLDRLTAVSSQPTTFLQPQVPPAFRITPPTPDMFEINKPLPKLPRWPQAPLVESSAVTRAVSMVRRRFSLSGRSSSRPPSIAPERRTSISPEDEAIPPDIKRFARTSVDDTRSRLHPTWKPRTSLSALDDLESDTWRTRNRRPATSDGQQRRQWQAEGLSRAQAQEPTVVDGGVGAKYGPSAFRGGRTKSHRIPGIPFEIEYVGWGGLREKMRESKMGKEERRREQNREKLKEMIGPRIVVSDQG